MQLSVNFHLQPFYVLLLSFNLKIAEPIQYLYMQSNLQASKKECTRLQQLVDSLKTDQKKTKAAKEELDRKLCASQKAETSLKVSIQ